MSMGTSLSHEHEHDRTYVERREVDVHEHPRTVSSSTVTSSSAVSTSYKTYEGDYHVALVKDQRETVEAYIDNNRDLLKLAATPLPWWSNRLVHRSFMVRRKLVELQRFLQRLGAYQTYCLYRSNSLKGESSFWGYEGKKKETDEEKVMYSLWGHRKTPKALELALNSLEERVDDFLGLYQEEKQLQIA